MFDKPPTPLQYWVIERRISPFGVEKQANLQVTQVKSWEAALTAAHRSPFASEVWELYGDTGPRRDGRYELIKRSQSVPPLRQRSKGKEQ